MISFAVIMGDELRDSSSEVLLAERNQPSRHSSLIDGTNRSA